MNHRYGKLRLCFAAALLALGVVAVAAPTASAIVRPRTATPFSVPATIAYDQCTVGNGTHNPANLAGFSCIPQTKSSPYLTAGNPQAGAGAANFEGRLHLVVCITAAACSGGGGSGSTDVLFPAGAPGKNYLFDVRCETAPPPPWSASFCTGANAAGGPDYGLTAPSPGAFLLAKATIRITDRNNDTTPPSCVGGYTCEGTVQDLEFPVPLVCFKSASTTIGGSCTPAVASANGACGGCVASGKLSNIEVGQIHIQDPGADGNALPAAGGGVGGTADNNDYARQGVFIP